MEELQLKDVLLPGVPIDRIAAIYGSGKGDEIRSGKFTNPDSSSCLAANTFGWFLETGRPPLPPFPGLEDCGVPEEPPELEAELRFPWSGGSKPVIDALVTTSTHLIGIESKRFEPFRSKGPPKISATYSREGVWGEAMQGYDGIRQALEKGKSPFKLLDATQLFKHALGLQTSAHRDPAPKKKPVLLYLYAEPTVWAGSGRPIEALMNEAHRKEIARFAKEVEGNEVRFFAMSYGVLLDAWSRSTNPLIAAHAAKVRARFGL